MLLRHWQRFLVPRRQLHNYFFGFSLTKAILFKGTSFVLLCLLLFTNMLVNLPVEATAARIRPLQIPQANFTLPQFLQQGTTHTTAQGRILPNASTASANNNAAKNTSVVQQPPSAEPPSVPAVSQSLSPDFLNPKGTQPATALTDANAVHLIGSNAQGTLLEITIPNGDLDLSHATTTQGKVPQGKLSLTLKQLHGHFIAATTELASFQLQLTDVQGQEVQGVKLRNPLTITYHYRSKEISTLGLDPAHLYLIWPNTKNTADTVVLMKNNTQSSTLTALSPTLSLQPFATGAATDPVQNPPTPIFASVQDNSGQLSYSYPLSVAPGPTGTAPQLQATYSSAMTNARHSPTTPAGNVGEGWNISLGSIMATKYSDGTIWYTINGIDGISDRLVPDTSGNNFATEHLSYLKVTKNTGLGCFQIWDKGGNYYEFGCTNDSLLYYIDSGGNRFNYGYGLDKFIPANEGSGTNGRNMTVSYVQDMETSGGHTWVRDSAIKQITYGNGTDRIGTVDFFYNGPANYTDPSSHIQYVTQYTSTYETNCHLPVSSPQPQRCDDPIDRSSGLPDPDVMSTLSLQTVKTYVGDNSSSSHLDYSYSFAYQDTAFGNCPSSVSSLSTAYCAGDHLLSSITPTVYQNATGHQLPGITFGYGGRTKNIYDDSTQSNYHMENSWNYLTSYHDHSNGTGDSSIVYKTAYNNSHGTPYTAGDNRYDPFYCDWNPTQCQSGTSYYPMDDKMWTMQAVTQMTAAGKDSSASSLSSATTKYDFWLIKTNGSCPADSTNDTDCVGYGWIPTQTTGWQDYYNGEFRGFGEGLVTSPAGDLTTNKYNATWGWDTAASDSRNYLVGQLNESDTYAGGTVTDANLLSKTVNTYGGQNTTHAACVSTSTYPSTTYQPCEAVLLSTRTTQYDKTGSSNSNAPWTEQDSTYDDYTSSGGLGDYHQSPATGSYHNQQQKVITSSNAPTVTKHWTYDTTNTTSSGQFYYDVNKIAHSDLVDANGHMWQCQDTIYDQGVASGVPQPDAGWATSVKDYSDCSNQGSTAIPTYTGYDKWGDPVASVDGVAAANTSLYSSAGCTLSTAPVFFPTGSWSGSTYTGCKAYDSVSSLPTDSWNAFGQHTATSYDVTQGLLPTSITDANSQVTSTHYSYDSSGNVTATISQPGETGSYTSQATRKSTCSDSSTLPCMEIDSNTTQYSSAITRIFYDALGRSIETLTPAPDAAHTVVMFTVYNDATHSIFKSQPFTVNSRTTWLDPNGATDSNGNTPGGTSTTLDALERTVSTTDALSHSSSMTYGLGTLSGDSNTYVFSSSIDANNHVQVSYTDALGRDRYLIVDNGVNGGTLTAVRKETTQYNALDLATSVVVTDLAPQTGQTITTLTTTTSYDDLGHMTTLNDPDRGTHTYTYNANGNVVKDVSGVRTIGTNYDLLDRVGCIQDSSVTPDVHGACSNGTNPFVQNTYDTDPTGVNWGSTNYAIGQITQSYAVNYFPGPDYAQGKVTQNYQYDQRGDVINQRLNITQTGGTLSFPTLPQYQKSLSYNDANQLTTTQTTVGGNAGYTFTQSYDSTTGVNNGLSNTSTANQSLAALSYNIQSLVSGIALNASGTTIGNFNYSYDGNLRLSDVSAKQVSGTIITDSAVLYDPAGNVTTRQVTQTAPTSGSTTEVENFCYNEQNQLVWAGNNGTVPAAGNGTCGSTTFQNPLGSAYNASFAYTHLGQLWQGPLNGTGTQEQYLYCNSGQPNQVTNLSAVSGAPTCSAPGSTDYTGSYNAWGDLSGRTYQSNTATLSYDGLDHLTRWNGPVPNGGSTNEEEWSMYDASGNRVVLRSFDGTNTAITVYAFGLEEHQYQYSGTGTNVTNTGNVYYYAIAGKLIGALIGTSTQTMTFFLTDALGSVITSYNNNAGSLAVQGYQGYGPYGNSRYNTGSIGTTKGFTGQYGDNQSGLDYYVARYYDPVIGRFLSADTVQNTLQGFDPYAYVGGNPETHNDPTGHCVPWCTIVAGAIIGGVAAAFTDIFTGHPVTAQDVIAGAIAGGLLAGLGVVIALLFPGLAAGSGVMSVIASALTIGKATWTSALIGSSIAGMVTGVVTGLIIDTVSIVSHWIASTFGPKPAPKPAPKPTPKPTSTPKPTQTSSPVTTRPTQPSRPVITQPTTTYRQPSPSSSYYTVVSGDSLSAISMRYYGTYFQWQKIYQANSGVVGGNPNLIYPGERLVIPR